MRQNVTRRGLMVSAAALAPALGFGLTACGPAPRTADALGNDDAIGIATRVRDGEITPTEALEAAIARTEHVNPQLNFIASPLFDAARARATQASQSNIAGPFAGVPTLIKDLTNLAGAPTHFGSRAFAAYIADAQPPYVDALLAAGLNPFGKSTTPEFGFTATTEPVLGGPTRNPWNPARSSGGSSGGAAVAVASGAAPIAHGTDGGGSIRIPASCCGLVGLKVSRDRHLLAGSPQPGLSISVPGCLSRSVRDTALWLSLTERSDAEAPFAPIGLVAGPNAQRLRIGVRTASWNNEQPDPQVAAAIEQASELCRGLGHEIVDAANPIDGAAFTQDFTLLWAAMAAGAAQEVVTAAPDAPLDQVLEPLTLGLAAMYRAAPRGALAAAIGRMIAASARYEAMFAEFDVLLTPVLASPAPEIGELDPTLPFNVGFPRLQAYVGYTPLLNAAGAPGISLPLGWSEDGMPIGAQFAGPAGGERRLLELAYELEQAQPWADRRPQVWAG